MAESPTLSAAPYEHPALDYAYLRQEGIRHLEGLIGHVWTDFNIHDPGLTILEQLCYALTDLAYRASHDVPDLLASSGEDAGRSLYSPATILTSHPVTLLDLRKVIVDVEGVKNAWIEEIADPGFSLHFHAGKRELRFQAEPPYTSPVQLRGLVRVLIEKSDIVDRATDAVKREVARRLHACRPLCSEFHEIAVLEAQPVQVFADVEIGPVDDAERVLTDIYLALAEHVSPSVSFKTLGEMLAAGKRSDEIFDGPALAHGFLDSRELAALQRKRALYTSDLIREIMGVPGVRAVRTIAVSASTKERQPWTLPLDTRRAPVFDPKGSVITLTKGRLRAQLNAARTLDAFIERRKQAAPRGALAPGERDILPPVGRDRDVAAYRSIQHDLPALYGVGANGLPDSVGPRRRAQAKQLKAYLLFFDQLLASYFAQLAHAGALLSFHGDEPRTYFTQMVDDASLGLEAVRLHEAATHRSRLERLADPERKPAERRLLELDIRPGLRERGLAEREDASTSLSDRKNRFYNHLMARFAEQFTDYSLVLFGAAARDKREFLQRYPRISSARGTGRDVLGGDASGLAERIKCKLGLVDDERFILIEHLLLAPLKQDGDTPTTLEYRQIPALSDAAGKDPYSLQLSFVLPKFRGRLRLVPGEVNELPLLVEQTIREETPAHLTPYIHWLDQDEWGPVEQAHAEWLDAFREYHDAKLGPALQDSARWFRLRDARDRLLGLLRLGATFPLRDLPVRDERLTVPFNQQAPIPIEASQRGVHYQLRNEKGDVLSEVVGDGGTIHLVSPPMKEDATFTILARKPGIEPNTYLEAYLEQTATVKVGLDLALRARIREAQALDPNIDAPADGDARIVDWGQIVRVQIDHAQEGVDYQLIQVVGDKERKLSPAVRGNLDDIILIAEPAREDMDIRIRATKVFDPSEHRPTQTDRLDAVLPLAVRARRDMSVAIEPSPIAAFGEGASVRIDDTQASADYLVYAHTLSYREFIFGEPGPSHLAVDVEGAPRVHVKRPPQHSLWDEIAGFRPVGAPVKGNGGALRLSVPGLNDDTVIVVRARKQHLANSTTVASAVQLAQAAVILVRPNPRPALRLGVTMADGHTTGTLDFSGGQPGVFYQARREPGAVSLGPPAYFHETDEQDPKVNKGIAQLRPTVDFVISRGTLRPAATGAEFAATPPLPPSVATGPLDPGTTLSFRAIKAQTRVAADLAQTIKLAPVPTIEAEQAAVPRDSAATIIVRASVAGDRYQLTQDGQPVGPPRDGDGTDLKLTSGPLQKATRFQVVVTRPGDPGIAVERRVQIAVTVT